IVNFLDLNIRKYTGLKINLNIMKNSFKLAALFLLLGTGAFAAPPTRLKSPAPTLAERVSLIPLHLKSGFAVMVDKREPGKSVVMIYDNDQNVIFKDVLTKR